MIPRPVQFAAATARWVAAGRPRRSRDEMAETVVICRGCDQYDGGKCKKCGCQLVASNGAYTVKLLMKTERCPLDPPKWS